VIEVDADQPPDAITREIVRALRRQAVVWTSPRVSTLFMRDR
jgi:hypothetical protein